VLVFHALGQPISGGCHAPILSQGEGSGRQDQQAGLNIFDCFIDRRD
jgi:hypothetical protein